jgi:hypothetical protein
LIVFRIGAVRDLPFCDESNNHSETVTTRNVDNSSLVALEKGQLLGYLSTLGVPKTKTTLLAFTPRENSSITFQSHHMRPAERQMNDLFLF